LDKPNFRQMNRRDFLHYTGAASLISTGIILPDTLQAWVPFTESNSFDDLFIKLIQLNDEQVPKILQLQNRDKTSKHFGGVCDNWKIYNPHSSAGLIKTLSVSYSSEKSKYYRDDSLIEPMILASKYLLKIQHNDGTIDLLSTNFHSTPDTAFIVEPIWLSYQLMKQDKNAIQLLDLLKQFMLKAGEAFVVGGIHTPNHRWVVSMALAMLNHTFPDERYKNRISEWLREGVDMDEDGQYEEKSTYIYTPLTNRCLMNIAMYDNRPELWEYVDKNLEMMMYYVHPNGEVETGASGRQDQFQAGFMEHYYLPYKMAATRGKRKPEFWAMVNLIEKTVPEKLLTYLPYFMINPWITTDFYKSEGGTVPDNYVREFRGSNLVRIRRGNIDATILGNNPTFLTVSKGNAVLASVRLASSFFGRGQFSSKIIEKSGDSFILKWEFHWGYFQPLPENQKPNYDIPFDEDRKRRSQSERQSLQTQITVTEKDGIFELGFELDGTENVPLAIEFAFRKGGKLTGVEILDESGAYLFKGDLAKYNFENDVIEFGPGLAEHEWTAIRGGLPKSAGDCVYITGFTPFKHQIKIG
jgi:hypothetical protein